MVVLIGQKSGFRGFFVVYITAHQCPLTCIDMHSSHLIVVNDLTMQFDEYQHRILYRAPVHPDALGLHWIASVCIDTHVTLRVEFDRVRSFICTACHFNAHYFAWHPNLFSDIFPHNCYTKFSLTSPKSTHAQSSIFHTSPRCSHISSSTVFQPMSSFTIPERASCLLCECGSSCFMYPMTGGNPSFVRYLNMRLFISFFFLGVLISGYF